MTEIVGGHVYLDTNKPMAEVGKAIVEEFTNWIYDAEENQIYQIEEDRKLCLWVWVLMILAGLILAFIYPFIGLGLLIALTIISIIWGDPKAIQEPVDYITIYEVDGEHPEDELPYNTHVDVTIFDNDGERNLTDEDIMNIFDRIGAARPINNINSMDNKE